MLQFAPPDADDEEQPLYLSGAFFQLYVTALEVGVLHALRDDAVAHVHQRARSFAWAPNPSAADDPLLQREIGEIAAAAYAGGGHRAGRRRRAGRSPSRPTCDKTDPDLELAHEASLQAAAAKVVVDALAQKAASQIFDVGGASVVRQAHLLDRHWRNIRTLASHNPSSYKAQAIGALLHPRHQTAGQRLLLTRDSRSSSRNHSGWNSANHENAPRYCAAGCRSLIRSVPNSLARVDPGAYSRWASPRSCSTGMTWSTNST